MAFLKQILRFNEFFKCDHLCEMNTNINFKLYKINATVDKKAISS